MLETPVQIREQFARSQSILIALRKHWDGDALASALALAWHLESQGKTVTIVADGFVFPKQFRFLKPEDGLFLSALRQLRKFIVSVDMARAKVAEFSYSVEGDHMHIYLTPEEGMFEPADVTTKSAGFRYDCIVTLGVPDLPSLGTTYDAQAEFFYTTPVVNIDHHAGNEHYGQMNHVDIVATTTAEALAVLCKETLGGIVNERCATAFLTGIIAGTKSFRSAAITPRCLQVVGDLIARGADREAIMQNLYRTRALTTLKLWGRVLTRIQESPEHKLIWSTITAEDLASTHASPNDATDVIDELMLTMPDPEVQVLFTERMSSNGDACDVMVNVERGADARMLLKPWNPQGARDRATAHVNGLPLAEVTTKVVEYIKKELAAGSKK
ncbi:hypothetical protein HY629_00065 [Candidatus Uhrbacteria bacterium]|nr:hypothetical protein [Candidatus Uhrbacteria bacterium]